MTGANVGQEMLTLCGTADFTPLGEFMISPIHYIYIIYYRICQFYVYVYRLMTGLFAWISLMLCLRRILFTVIIIHDRNQFYMMRVCVESL